MSDNWWLIFIVVAATAGVSSACPFMEMNVDYVGHDIEKISADSSEACCSACLAAHTKSASSCLFWSYNPGLRHCYFKSSDTGRTPRDRQVSGSVTKYPGSKCTTDMECSLNGQCKNHSCDCDRGWKGDACDMLDFKPMESKEQILQGAYRGGYASWGASVIFDNGKYHMFVAEMAGHCGLNSYTYNSVVVHAVADDPSGPFIRDRVVVPNQAHNPTVVKAPNGW